MVAALPASPPGNGGGGTTVKAAPPPPFDKERTVADRAVAVVTPDAARARALAIIKQHTEAVSFVRSEDLDTQGMFLPVVAVVPIEPADLHQLGGGMMMPKKHHVDRMAEAAGVDVTSVNVEHPSTYVWTAKAHGTKRMPDGSMREGEGEYAFDAETYAELDFIKNADRYRSDVAKRQHLLEYAKFGHQRASTGARLALIRYFCKCPTAFKAADLPRAMIFSRVDLNTDGLLAAPEMREAAIAHAVGATRTLFGSAATPATERNVTPAESPEAPLGGESAEADPFDDETAQPTKAEPTHEDEARATLAEWAQSDVVKSHAKASAAIAAMLVNPGATLEEMQDLASKCKKLAERAGGAA